MTPFVRSAVPFFMLIASAIGCGDDKPRTWSDGTPYYTPAPPTPAPPSESEIQTKAWDDHLIVAKSDWRTDGFGAVSLWNLTIKNRGPVAHCDLAYEIIYIAPSGTQVSRQTGTIFDCVQPGKTKRFKDFNTGFVNLGGNGPEATRAHFRLVGVGR